LIKSTSHTLAPTRVEADESSVSNSSNPKTEYGDRSAKKRPTPCGLDEYLATQRAKNAKYSRDSYHRQKARIQVLENEVKEAKRIHKDLESEYERLLRLVSLAKKAIVHHGLIRELPYGPGLVNKDRGLLARMSRMSPSLGTYHFFDAPRIEMSTSLHQGVSSHMLLNSQGTPRPYHTANTILSGSATIGGGPSIPMQPNLNLCFLGHGRLPGHFQFPWIHTPGNIRLGNQSMTVSSGPTLPVAPLDVLTLQIPR